MPGGKAIREIRVHNSMTGKKEVLETLEPGKIRMYSCGPTVYNPIHIGNLRAALTPDLFFRYFKKVGYDVTYVRNYTDVDDKIIQKAHEEKTLADQIAKKYTQEVERDYALAAIEHPTHTPTVTAHMQDIISMIEVLIKKGHAYEVQGEVLYSVESFKTYGCLSHRKFEDMEAGIRVEIDKKKKNPLDFALWKPAKPGEPSWDSPWGKGRPGWHIECSAMSKSKLGEQIDIHHGGEDLIFPHHENEIAQSEGATGKAPFVRYWLHNAFLNLSKQKMSKSLGNVFLARDFLAQFGGEFARYVFLTVHYRSMLEFGDEAIETALTGLTRIYEAKKKAQELLLHKAALPDQRAESAWGSFVAETERTRTLIDDAFANDFNTPDAMAAFFTLIREFNRTCAEPRAQATPSASLGAQALLHLIESDIGEVIGIGRSDPARMFEQIEKIRAHRLAASGISKPTDAEIEALIQERLDARAKKDFARADQIRKDLDARGVLLKDGPSGTTWSYK